MNDYTAALTAVVFSTVFLAIFVPVFIGLYLFVSWVHYRIGKKFGIGSFGEFCIPIYSWVLLCRCAGLSGWNVLWFFVPLANFVFAVFFWGTIAERLGHSFWGYGLCIFLFGIPVYILAFDSSSYVGEPFQTGPSVYCVSGEYAGNRVYVGNDGLVMGRNPSQAHLVLSSPEISGSHIRIWPDHGSGGLWIQDMQSLNGTYYSEAGQSGQPPRWAELREPTLLTAGTHFRLGDNVAEFMVS